jgi:hypothetical protein
MSHRWRGAVHVAPRFAPNGAENAVRGATRGRAANSGSVSDCETRLPITTSSGATRFIARGRVKSAPRGVGSSSESLRETGCRSSTPTTGAGKCARVSSVGAAREFGLHIGLHETPPQHKLARCHTIHCRRQGQECAPSRGVQPNDASSGTFFAGNRGLKFDRMALRHTAPDPDGAALRILASSRTPENACLQ